MNKEVLIDIGSQLIHLRMYPLFDMCHYLLIALQVRDDIQQYQTGSKFIVLNFNALPNYTVFEYCA
jgi:hypothetical protein